MRRNRTINPNTGYPNLIAYSGEIVVPQTITYQNKTYTVSSIAYASEKTASSTTVNMSYPVDKTSNVASSKITKITLPETITEIPASSFEGCSGLEEIKFSDQIKKIDNYTFRNCTKLSRVNATAKSIFNLPKSLESIGKEAFLNSGVITVTIPPLKSWDTESFKGCEKLTSIYIDGVDADKDTKNEYVHAIPMYSFGNCPNVSVIAIHGGHTTIYHHAFGLDKKTTHKLTDVYFTGDTPPTRQGNGGFENIPRQAYCRVSPDLTDAQKAAWKKWDNQTWNHPFIGVAYDSTVGVGGIETDEQTQPERWFNMQGMEMQPTENLAPGIYIKVQGNKRMKVIVK